MDTDDLTDKAYQMIVIAGDISDYLRCDIGIRSKDYVNEDDYLAGMLSFLKKIAKHSQEYLEYWALFDIDPIHFETRVRDLTSYISKIIEMPIEERGNIEICS